MTMTTLPKISLLPAFVAGLVRVFSRHKPGMENTPVFLHSFDAIVVSELSKLEHTFCLSSRPVDKALAMLPFVMARTAVFVVAFMGLFVLGNMDARDTERN